MSKENDTAESPTTTSEGQQICNSIDGSIDTAIASKPTADDENEASIPAADDENEASKPTADNEDEDDMFTDWAIEGVEGLEGDTLRHMNAFYVLLKDLFCQKNYTSILLTREGYNKRVEFGLYLNNGSDSREGQLNGNSNAYKWASKYHVMTVGESNVLVLHPKKEGSLYISAMRLEDLQKPTDAERLFTNLWKIHQDDHCKGNTFFFCSRDQHTHSNYPLSKRQHSCYLKCVVNFYMGIHMNLGIPIWKRGSPFLYGDPTHMDPHYHTGISIWEPGYHFHMGIRHKWIPITIRGSQYRTGD
jgi:hypothetical protein